MRIAHILTVHKSPVQLERLLSVMAHPDFDFYIHVDKKVDIELFKYLGKQEQVYFIQDRTVCNWGGFSLVKAITKSIDELQASGRNYDFVNLLSAQDFPIKPISFIHDFFTKNIGFSFLSFEPSTDTPWWDKAVLRYTKYHFTDYTFKGVFLLQRLLNYVAPNRKTLSEFSAIYGGSKSTWWTITYESALYLSSYFKQHPKLRKELNYTWGCDEIIIATILMNSPFKSQIINENYRYIVFSDNDGHPDFLTIQDYDKIINSGMLFARKFDPKVDADILDKLQSTILTP